MGRPKIKRKKPAAAPSTRFVVRLRRDEALELMRIGGEDPAMAERHLRMLRPRLSEAARREVAWRCADPQARGGITTGTDPETGDWAEIAVTKADR